MEDWPLSVSFLARVPHLLPSPERPSIPGPNVMDEERKFGRGLMLLPAASNFILKGRRRKGAWEDRSRFPRWRQAENQDKWTLCSFQCLVLATKLGFLVHSLLATFLLGALGLAVVADWMPKDAGVR